jgi:uncharacterized protein
MQQADTTETSRHRLIDADTHVNEPPNLWLDRVPARFREQVPRIQRFEEGDAWVMEGVKDPINFGLNAGATLRREERRPWVRFEDIPRGGYDPVVRLQEMDADLVDAAVLYPTPRLSHLVIATPEPDRHLVMVQAYNDWLAEYASHDTRRLGGVARSGASRPCPASSACWWAATPTATRTWRPRTTSCGRPRSRWGCRCTCT